MAAQRFEFDVNGSPSSGLIYDVAQPRAVVVLGHGAGGRQSHPWMVAMARTLASRGLAVVTFDFLYSHAGRRLPDKNDVLEATFLAALSAVRARRELAPLPCFIGGKSMGGRIASQVAAADGGPEAAGVILLGYPLHPPGKPDRLRAAHLAKIRVPMLFVQGSRDAFGAPDELRPILESLPVLARLFVVEGGDHSLAPPRRAGTTLAEALESAADEIGRFVSSRQ